MDYCRVHIIKTDADKKNAGINYDFAFGTDDAKISLYSNADYIVLDQIRYKVIKRTLSTELTWLLTIYVKQDEDQVF